MTRFFKTCFLALALALSACGGAEDDDLFDDVELSDGGEELGSLEQGMSAQESPTAEFGVRTGSTHLKADRATTGQVATVPSTKQMTVCRVAGSPGVVTFGPVLEAAINKMFPQVDAWSNFTYAHVPLDLFGQCDSGSPPYITFTSGAVGSSGTGSNTITDYVGFTPNFLTGLTEGPGVTGQRQSAGNCSCKLDETDILAKGATSTQDRNIAEHAVAACLVMCGGVGLKSWGSTSTNYSRTEVNGLQAVTTMTAGEVCMQNGFVTSTPANFNEQLVDCAND